MGRGGVASRRGVVGGGGRGLGGGGVSWSGLVRFTPVYSGLVWFHPVGACLDQGTKGPRDQETKGLRNGPALIFAYFSGGPIRVGHGTAEGGNRETCEPRKLPAAGWSRREGPQGSQTLGCGRPAIWASRCRAAYRPTVSWSVVSSSRSLVLVSSRGTR